jgi:(p)ppGpp synthase/HD superfamily hydrolase
MKLLHWKEMLNSTRYEGDSSQPSPYPIHEIAESFAREKHANQLDDSGKSYFDSHISQVVSILLKVTRDRSIIAAAYLHDTIEDTDTTYEELKKVFGKKIADLVNEVTHEGSKDSAGYYFPRLESREAFLIKFADRLSNLSRMEPWDKKRQEQYMRKSRFWNDGKSLRHLSKYTEDL